MKKALMIIALAALLAIPLVGLTGCGNTLSDSDLATIRGFGTRMDDAEKDIGTLKADLAAIGSGSGVEGIEAGIADIEEILDGIAGDIADIEDDNIALAERITALENNQDPGTTNPTTGQVTVQLVDNSLCVQSGQLRVFSGPAPGGMQYTFTVDIVNGTSQYQYVSFGLILNCINPSAGVTTFADPPALTIFGGYGVTYTKIDITSSGKIIQVLFTPSQKVSVAANGALQMQFMLTMQTDISAQWEGSVTALAVSSTW